MRVGLLARSEDRGLGHLTWDFYRAVEPERTLLVELDRAMTRGFATHPERFPGATRVSWDAGELPEATVRNWLTGLDVVYSAETWYDPRLPLWAAEAGVATVLHVMPEFYRPDLPGATVTWAPTTWLLDTLPALTRVVPVPCDIPANIFHSKVTSGPLRILHVAGHRAAADRNGTSVLAAALRMVSEPLDVRLTCQDRRMPVMRGRRAGVIVRVEKGGHAERSALYADADLLVLPRRYGGLCLPAQEAAAAGLGLVMTSCPPNPTTWPISGIRSLRGGTLNTPSGVVDLAEPDPRHLATLLNDLARTPEVVAKLRQAASEWAALHSWDMMLPLYRSELRSAVVRFGNGW